jgi:hypothetical protein
MNGLLPLDLPRVVPPRAAPGRGSGTADLAGWLVKHAETREIPMLITWVQLATLADVAVALWAPERLPFDAKRAEALQAAREFAEWVMERAAPGESSKLVSWIGGAKVGALVEELRERLAKRRAP